MKQTLSGNIIDIHARRIYGGTVTIDDGRIVAVEEDGHTYDRYLAPGLVDAHVHIESSMLTPEEFARTVIAHGTVAVVSENYGIPVYASRGTLREVKSRLDLKGGFYFEKMRTFSLAGMEITPFSTPHDAVQPVGYSISAGGLRYTQATDIGYFSPEVESKMLRSDIVLIESNHDVDMLINGRYPVCLKERILSRSGHLSNAGCAEAVLKILDSGTRNIILGHLSEHNNTTELAYETTAEAIEKRGGSVGKDCVLVVANRRTATRGVEL